MTRRFASFAATHALDEAELRAIAGHGDPHDRVLACWRLMIRGQAIQSLTDADPDAGIRRLLLLNLAITRETELLATLVHSDPDSSTRTEALVLLHRIDPERGLRCMRAALTEADDDTLLSMLATALPWPALTAEFEPLLHRSEPALRRRACDRLLTGRHVPDSVRRAAIREPEPALRAHIVARWAASDDHAALLEHVDELGTPALDALHAAARTYPCATLAVRLADTPESKRMQLMGPSYSPAERRWLLDRILAVLTIDPEPVMGPLALAYEDCPLDDLTPEERTVVQLATHRHEAPWEPLRPELERLVEHAGEPLCQLAAGVLIALSSEFPRVIRRLTIRRGYPWDDRYLDLWAESDDHRSLLAAAIDPAELGPPVDIDHWRSAAIIALENASRCYSADELAPLAALPLDPLDRASLEFLREP